MKILVKGERQNLMCTPTKQTSSSLFLRTSNNKNDRGPQLSDPKLLVHYVTSVFSITVLRVLKYKICDIGYCDVVNVQPHFNFSDEIIK